MLAELTYGIGSGDVIRMHDDADSSSRRGAGETVELIAPLVKLIRERGLKAGPIEPALPILMPEEQAAPAETLDAARTHRPDGAIVRDGAVSRCLPKGFIDPVGFR